METKVGKTETVKRDLTKPFGGRGLGKHRIRACGGGPSGGSQVYGVTHEQDALFSAIPAKAPTPSSCGKCHME